MMRTLILLAMMLAAGTRAATPPVPGLEPAVFDPPPSGKEMKHYPARAVPGHPPASGIRYWSEPLWRLPYRGCYVTVIRRDEPGQTPEVELWQNGWGETIRERDIRVRRGPGIGDLGPPQSIFDGTLIDDVPVPAAPRSLAAREPWELSPLRGFTRPVMHYEPGQGYVLMACVCPDYKPGSVTLLPAVVTSRTGTKGTWQYRGMIKGEPQDEQRRLGRPVWSDGGSLFRLSDGWRMYLNGFGQTLAALHAASLDGPWKFLRSEDGAIRELVHVAGDGEPFPTCFPYVLRVASDEWHLWLSDRWPCQSVWHFWSPDGLAWEPYGRQPEITRAAVNGHGIKCLRAYVSEDGKQILGLLSVWTDDLDPGEKSWQLHLTTMPVGPPPP
jgi:hypothetical protein